MRRLPVLCATLFLLGACSIDDFAIAPGGGMDSGPADSATDCPPDSSLPRDSAVADADTSTRDTGGPDTAMMDSGRDARTRPPRCDATDLGLLGCYLFEDNLDDGSMYANHASGSGYVFTLGVDRRAFVSNGTADVTAPHFARMDTQTMTLEAWVRVDRLPGAGRMTLVEKDDQYGLFILPDGSVRFRIGFDVGPTEARSPVPTIAPGRWYHAAGTYDGVTQRVYIDGAEVGAVVPSGMPGYNSGLLHIGEQGPGGGDDLEGALDTLRVYDYARTATEVAAAAIRLSVTP